MKELENPSDYFPYIGHTLDQHFFTRSNYYIHIVGDIFEEVNRKQLDADTILLDGMTGKSVFRKILVKGVKRQRELAKSDSAVELLVPRHRSLFDYCSGLPVHNQLINQNVLTVAGNNLFVLKFDWFLRKYGAFVFLREDVMLKKKHYPKVFLSQKKYIEEVFPAYMKQEMLDGKGIAKAKMDVILYAEQEKDPVTKKRSGGRTKSGKLRNLSHIVFDKLKSITRDSDTELYVTPMNISYSKYPEAPYIVHPSKSKGFIKGVRYMMEQIFTFKGYPQFAHNHTDARLEATVHYGEPILLHADNFNSMSDLLRFSGTLREKIGRLEAVYPLTLLFRAMDADLDVSIAELTERAKKLFDRYKELGIDVENVSDGNGNLLDMNIIAERAIRIVNVNPTLYISGIRTHDFLSIESGRVVSHDAKLQAWYANHLKHLDHDCPPHE